MLLQFAFYVGNERIRYAWDFSHYNNAYNQMLYFFYKHYKFAKYTIFFRGLSANKKHTSYVDKTVKKEQSNKALSFDGSSLM